MRYIKLLLLPDEHVLFNARFHPILYAPGLFWLSLTIAAWHFGPEIVYSNKTLLTYWSKLYYYNGWSRHLPRIVLGAAALYAVSLLGKAMTLIQFTELVVTDRRVIAKTGILTTTTVEMDRRRIAEVIVTQPLLGRILNYGFVQLRGFAGDIRGLPAVSHPAQLQQTVNRGY